MLSSATTTSAMISAGFKRKVKKGGELESEVCSGGKFFFFGGGIFILGDVFSGSSEGAIFNVDWASKDPLHWPPRPSAS